MLFGVKKIIIVKQILSDPHLLNNLENCWFIMDYYIVYLLLFIYYSVLLLFKNNKQKNKHKSLSHQLDQTLHNRSAILIRFYECDIY